MGDTIVAQATPSGESALALIRLSGELCLKIIKESCGLPYPTPRNAYYKKYKSVSNDTIDQVVVTYYEEKKSFTSERSLEITCHGNPIIVRSIIEDLLERGCRIAKPGEFTLKSYLNGKIDLIQAEAIADLIGAKSKIAIELANKNLNGELSDKISRIQSNCIEQQAIIEAFIDFPEDDIGSEQTENVINELEKSAKEIKSLLDISERCDIFNDIINVVLVGPPNVGKSSLFNCIIGNERAIVDKEAGTTRDFIEQKIYLGKTYINMYDTAGLREAKNRIENKGILKTKELIVNSDLLLLVLDNSSPYPRSFNKEIKSLLQTNNVILILNKTDLTTKLDLSDTQLNHLEKCYSTIKDKTSIDEIIRKISTQLNTLFEKHKEFGLYVNMRQSNSLKASYESIDICIRRITSKIDIEFCVPDLKNVILNLGEIVGVKDNEDMLDQLFSNFCIGK